MTLILDPETMIQYAIRHAGKPAIYLEVRGRINRNLRNALPAKYYDAGVFSKLHNPVVMLFDTEAERDEVFALFTETGMDYRLDEAGIYAEKYNADGTLVEDNFFDNSEYYCVDLRDETVIRLSSLLMFERYRDYYRERSRYDVTLHASIVTSANENIWTIVLHKHHPLHEDDSKRVLEMIG